MKKHPETEGPFELIGRGLEVLKWWVPVLILVSAVCFVGMVVFAVLWRMK